jgi:hypothetical protein
MKRWIRGPPKVEIAAAAGKETSQLAGFLSRSVRDLACTHPVQFSKGFRSLD